MLTLLAVIGALAILAFLLPFAFAAGVLAFFHHLIRRWEGAKPERVGLYMASLLTERDNDFIIETVNVFCEEAKNRIVKNAAARDVAEASTHAARLGATWEEIERAVKAARGQA